ncbi:MAG: transposase family protein [Trichloromonadaceae bacterium]
MAKRAVNRYSIANLVALGIGERTVLFRQIKKLGIKGLSAKNDQNKLIQFYRYKDLPPEWQAKIDRAEAEKTLAEHGIDPALPVNPATVEETAIAYTEAPVYNRRKFDKYAALLQKFELYEGQELKDKIGAWNQKHPSQKTSYPSIMRARKAAKEKGEAALIGEWGKRRGQRIVADTLLEKFKAEYLKEGGPSANSCWRTLIGGECEAGDLPGFPSVDSFLRAIRGAVGESAIFLARNGFKKWNRRFASYIERDFSNLKAGQCWVSDHAQIDVMVRDPATGKTACGWITSFMDMKSGKVLAAFYHIEAPNSDHVFQAFYMTAERFGLPEYVYIDNGKDYRCRDFAGGKHKVVVDEKRAASMLAAVGVKVIFSLPYNAQAKTVERMHLKIKEGFSKHLVGYRGGNVVERPEKLAAEIKAGAILDFAEFRGHLYDWIENAMNKMPSKGKVLQGKAPDDQWHLENPEKRTISREALRLFCMRTSRPLTIGRNGVTDSALNVTYWAEWMSPLKGRKVYLRRPVEDFNECWVFATETDEYLGNASIRGMVPAIVEDEVGRQQLKDAMAAKRREIKAVKELGLVKHTPDVATFVNQQKAAAELLNPAKVAPAVKTVVRIERTEMDDAVRQRKSAEGPVPDPSTARLAAELDHAKRQLFAASARFIQFPSEREDKDRDIAHWQQEANRLQAAWNAAKVTPLRLAENSEPGGVDSRRAQSGR